MNQEIAMRAIHQVMNADRSRRANAARAGKNRVRGQGHPTTSDIDYSRREMEFLRAIEEFKLRTGRKFPTWREVLRVFENLGYCRVDPDGPVGSTAA